MCTEILQLIYSSWIIVIIWKQFSKNNTDTTFLTYYKCAFWASRRHSFVHYAPLWVFSLCWLRRLSIIMFEMKTCALPLQKLLGRSPSGTQSLPDPVECVSDVETLSLSLHAENAGYVSAEHKSQTNFKYTTDALSLFLKYHLYFSIEQLI